LIEQLNAGLSRKLTLISAPAGFGKTTLVSAWVAGCGRPAAWLSLDDGDNDPARFLTYLVAALQTIAPQVGKGLLDGLQTPQPQSIESILITLLNEITTTVPEDFLLILDDYHVIDAKAVDHALTYLLEHLPSRMHLVIATREDPQLPLARLRARGQLTELRAADLRFTSAEAADFLNQVMGLNLSPGDIAALEARTEGWIVGLQLAAISIKGHPDASDFIESFTGSHHFVMDYLVEEILKRQPESIQSFLLRTSILDRLCGPLCDAVLLAPSASGQETLESLERANLFIIPLDNERRWYRYHHLFADLLRQRLHQSAFDMAELHERASIWFEDHGQEIEAFHHAAEAHDVGRAARLIEGKGMPLHVRGALIPVLNWLKSLPTAVLDEKPMLWVIYAGALTTAGQTADVEQKLQAAETALQGAKLGEETRDLLGRIANNRATLAVSQYQLEAAIVQAQRALEYLRPDNLPVRAIATWALGAAYQFKGNRSEARRTYTQALSISQAIGHTFVTKLVTIGLGYLQEVDNDLHLAAETYRRALQLFGDQPLPIACEAQLGLAHIFYEWNELVVAQQYGQESLRLARQFAEMIDRFVVCEVFLARWMLAKGDITGASSMLAQADQSTRQHRFVHRMPEVAAAQVLCLLRQGDRTAAARLAQTFDLPISQARVALAQGDSSTALGVLVPLSKQMEEKGWEDERLRIKVLQSVALHSQGKREEAVQMLGEALALAEPGGFIRLFVDEGPQMAQILSEAASRGIHPNYVGKLLANFEAEAQGRKGQPHRPPAQPLLEPLSSRELVILQLIAEGLTNQAISERLFLAVSTVKGHNRNIFGKLHVQNRTEAVARARELGLL
jgi:LuxR family maltose regulon positive regulatory protein